MTNLLKGEEIVSSAEGLISAKKQQGEFSLDLTVNTISLINLGGALDFGGSEYQEASVSLLEPEKKTPDEPYGWWNLDTGDYLIRFNEKIKIPAKWSHHDFAPRETARGRSITRPISHRKPGSKYQCADSRGTGRAEDQTKCQGVKGCVCRALIGE